MCNLQLFILKVFIEEWFYRSVCFQNGHLVPLKSLEPLLLSSRICTCVVSGINLWERRSLSLYSLWLKFHVGQEGAHKHPRRSPSTFLTSDGRVCGLDKNHMGASRLEYCCWICQFLWEKQWRVLPNSKRARVLLGLKVSWLDPRGYLDGRG